MAELAEKLVFRAMVYPGDLLMLTSAIRDLHEAYPKRFVTDVDTTCREIWRNNPYVNRVDRNDFHLYLDLGYPPYSHDEPNPEHLATRYHNRMSERLGIPVPVTRPSPQIYVTEEEKDPEFPVSLGLQKPYWVIIGGAKYDTTTKWWNPAYYQEVVDQLKGKIDFVQCGAASDWHQPLNGVVNMVGKTDIRKLVRLIYHADGVFCPVTFAMHLAAAVPTGNGEPRACVVIVGGRETPSLIQYPNHKLLTVIGQLSCCQSGGCWRYVCQETHVRQNVRSRCEMPVQVTPDLKLPLCMEMIRPANVVAAILQYYPDGDPALTSKPWFEEGPMDHSEPVPKRFAYTHPRHLQELYENAGGQNLYRRAIRGAGDFAQLAKANGPADLVLVGNFLDGSKELVEYCEKQGIDRVYGEFGWFPHYKTVHADPMGYAWESSLCGMKFSGLTLKQRAQVTKFRREFLSKTGGGLPEGVREPFVLWPLQLIVDRVNKYDLNLPDWYDLLLWTRQAVPVGYQFVIKDHPVQSVHQRIELSRCFPDTILLERSAPLRPLIEHAAGVIGCNSTVLLESRLLFRKPTWAYGHSWYTGHPDLIFPVNRFETLPHAELLGKSIDDQWLLDYGDWFLWQLLARQYLAEEAQKNPQAFLRWIHRRSYNSFVSLGEDAFN
jgi:ADP-heptose:LPS heptosyltransferase